MGWSGSELCEDLEIPCSSIVISLLAVKQDSVLMQLCCVLVYVFVVTTP